MQIDFKALEQALAPIEDIGQGELTFDASSTTITVRVLLPAEEVEAQKHAAGALNEADEGEHSAVDYLDRFRTACLSHAVIAVGEMDFRGVEYVETGEILDGGKAIKITKPKAMRELLARWTRPTLTAVFSKFNELVQRTEAEAEKLIEFEPSNLPAELDRLTKRMDEIKAQIQQEETAEKTKFSDKVGALAESDSGGIQVVPDPAAENEDGDEPKLDPEQLMPPAAKRTGPISPQSAPPPAERSVEPPRKAAPEQPLHRPEPSRSDSSFIDPDDDDATTAALDAEHNRIAEMRRRAAQGRPPADEGSALEMVHPQMGGRRPPHADAREAEEEIGVLDAASRQGADVPVLDLPAQDLGTRRTAPKGRAAVNKVKEDGGSKNPRFTPRQKP